MLQLGTFAFAQPWLLLALAGLPVLWWLLRVTPPAPRRLRFPAIRLLLGLTPPEETPAHTPLWLLLLRFAIAALLILGAASPLVNPIGQLSGSGPLFLVIDDGWAAARNWTARQLLLERLLDQAERESRAVMVLSTAPAAREQPVAASGLLPVGDARRTVRSLAPKPWPVDRAAAHSAIEGLELPGSAHVVWLSDGLAQGPVEAMATRLQALGRLDLIQESGPALPHLVGPAENSGTRLTLRAQRATGSGDEAITLVALADDGRLVARTEIAFPEGETLAEATVPLPVELRNRIGRIVTEGEEHAGAVRLLDEQWRRRPVGLVSQGPLEAAQPLLSELYYLERALAPFTELRRGTVEELLQRGLAVLALPDVGAIEGQEARALTDWIEAGGLLLRFAGPRLAESGGDELLPVMLRGGGRILGGVLNWDSPARLAPFAPDSPFAGLTIPDDVLVRRQVLAEPTLDLAGKTWVRLNDGTPLITAEPKGEGWVVLVHTTANTDWSNLALSGLFVEILRKVVAISQGVAEASGADATLAPQGNLDGFGRLGPPPATALAISGQDIIDGKVGPRHPPGYYGSDSARRALNLMQAVDSLQPITALPAGVARQSYSGAREIDLKPWLLAAALGLGLIDLLIALSLRGLLRQPAPPGRKELRSLTTGLALLALLGGLLAALAVTKTARAQNAYSDDSLALQATLDTRLAFVETGVPAVDRISEAGLIGLTRVLQRRTSVDAGLPLGVDPEQDEILFFPLLYWPVTPEQRALSEIARRRVEHYLTSGGTILFDLREPGSGVQLFGRVSRATEALRRLTDGLDVPPLKPVPPDHVLTKAFYLMQDFPGRFAGGRLWVGETEGRINDGVASVLIGGNDWAAAWAVNELGQPLFAVVPGGERQREMAYRVGVNLVMFALTGNYKADQVHVPFILERLGQ